MTQGVTVRANEERPLVFSESIGSYSSGLAKLVRCRNEATILRVNLIQKKIKPVAGEEGLRLDNIF